jgi:YD repeat-containing protein
MAALSQVNNSGSNPSGNPVPASSSWTLDSDDNRYGGKYGSSYNAVNEVTQNNGDLYNGLGYATAITFPSGDAVGLKYDAWGRMVGTTTTTGFAGSISYQYDAMGRQISSTDATSGSVLTQDYYDGGNLIEERNAGGTVTSQYVYSGEGGSHLVLRDQPGATVSRIYALADAAGSVTAVVGYTSGSWQVPERYLYDQDGRAMAVHADL